MFNKHPRRVDRSQLFFAKFSISSLVGIFILIMIFIAQIFASAFYVAQTPGEHSYSYWYQQSLLSLATMGGGGAPPSERITVQFAIQAALSLTAVVLPALFIGALVNKLVAPGRAFVFRNSIALYDDPRKGRVAAIRLYNATGRDLVNVEFEVIARRYLLKPNGAKSLINTTLAIDGLGRWPLSRDRVPFTLYLKAPTEGTSKEQCAAAFLSASGSVVCDASEILVFAKGTFRDTSMSVCDNYTFRLPAGVSNGAFVDIDVDYNKAPKSWSGWQRFDDVVE